MQPAPLGVDVVDHGMSNTLRRIFTSGEDEERDSAVQPDFEIIRLVRNSGLVDHLEEGGGRGGALYPFVPAVGNCTTGASLA